MTCLKKGREGSAKFSFGSIALGLMSVVTLFAVMKYPDVAIEYMQRGLKLCVGVVIPSLFPFMVASELIVMAGGISLLEKPLGIFSRSLFGIGGKGATAFILGTVCGFPIGTRVAVSLYKRGEISFDELCRIVCFSNNPSSAFVISAVGVTLFGCRTFGVALYFITVLSSVLVGITQNILFGKNKKVTAIIAVAGDTGKVRGRGIGDFSSAVTSSALSMLYVCAFVVFFSTFTGTLNEVISFFGISGAASAILFSFFELTGGAVAAACVRPMNIAALIAAFAVGWSGLSVHFQMISVSDGISLPFGRYFLSKLFEGVLNVILVWIYLSFFGKTLVFEAQSVGVLSYASAEVLSVGAFISCLFLVVLLYRVVNKKRKSI